MEGFISTSQNHSMKTAPLVFMLALFTVIVLAASSIRSNKAGGPPPQQAVPPEPRSSGLLPGRDLSTPLARLAGHWKQVTSRDDRSSHFYFTPPNNEGVGMYIMVEPKGKVVRKEYSIVKEDKEGEVLVFDNIFNSGKRRKETVKVSIDGMKVNQEHDFFGMRMSWEWVYVDGRQKPANLNTSPEVNRK